MNSTIKTDVPSKFTKKRTDQPWLSRELKRRCRRKQRLYNKWKKMKSKNKSCAAARENYKKIHQETNTLLSKARNQYINNILTEGLENKTQKPFWRYIKSQRTESTGVAPLKESGQLHSESSKKASILANQFRSVFTVDDDEAADTFLEGPSYPPMDDITIDEAGVVKLLKGVDPSKASGPDQIPCKLLCELHVELAPVFTILFQTSYDSGSIPSVWKAAWITPVFKKGDKCVAANYRPVSLTCVSCKLLEHILCSQIRDYLDKHGIITPYQHGFRQRLSCESQLLVTTHDLLKRLDKKDEVDIAILDFSKAFDVVPHQRLLRKLRLYGIEGRTLDWISCFLQGRTQSVVVDGVRSHSRNRTDGDDVLSGVPQGTVMGPLLFLMYINDLPSVLDPTTACRLFADDCLIYRSINSIADHVALQKDLEALYNWGLKWGLKFNVSKCNIMHLDRKQVHSTRFYTLGGEVINSVSEAQYLGVTFSNSYITRASQWKAHINEIGKKASRKLGFLRRNLGSCPYKLREVGYISLVRSGLEYCGAIWDTTVDCEADRLEMIQRRAARWATGARGIISVTKLLSEDLKWQPLSDRRCNQRLSLFYKILNGHINIRPEEVSLHKAAPRRTHKHKDVLKRDRGKDTYSPYWKGPICRTIPVWNNLDRSVAEADTPLSFKCQLAPSAP